MIQIQTNINIADNSGVKKIMCINILGSRKQFAKIGDIIIGVVKKAIPNMTIKRSAIVRALIIRTSKNFRRKNGLNLKFKNNAAIIINKDNSPCGTRIFGPITEEIRIKKFAKITALTSNII